MFDCPRIYFAVPGDLTSATGGYAYDRAIIARLRELGLVVEVLTLSAEFPFPTRTTHKVTAARFAALPAGAQVIVDGLAFGAMAEIAETEQHRLRLLALCHHPLALETGLDENVAADLRQSETRALAAAVAVIVTSAATARLLERDFGVPAHKITLAPPGTRPSRLAVGAAPEPARLLTLATLTRRKGHDLIITALADLKHLQWQARFVGGENFDGAWAAHLRRRVAREQLDDRIHFVGQVADPAEEFHRADLFVLPSRFEGYGMAFAEALACGLPVVGAHAGAVPDLVPPDAGILVPPEDPNPLAAAISRLLTDANLREQLRAGARRAGLSLPTWESSARVIGQLLRLTRCA